MNKTKWAAALVAVAAVMLLLVSGVTNAQTEPSAKTIGAGYVRLTEDHVLPGGLTLGAFVRTDSPSKKCLVTLSESSFALAGTTVYCGSRVRNDRYGIWLHVFLPQDAPADFIMTFTVYQTGAQGYGRPIRSFGR